MILLFYDGFNLDGSIGVLLGNNLTNGVEFHEFLLRAKHLQFAQLI